MNTRVRSRQNRAGFQSKRRDFTALTMADVPENVADTFDPLEKILVELETTGDIDHDNQGAVYCAPGEHKWYDMAGAFIGVTEFYEAHARISGREMPTAPLRQLANKFSYGMYIFPSDITAVRAALVTLKAETLPMTGAYARQLLNAIQEAA